MSTRDSLCKVVLRIEAGHVMLDRVTMDKGDEAATTTVKQDDTEDQQWQCAAGANMLPVLESLCKAVPALYQPPLPPHGILLHDHQPSPNEGSGELGNRTRKPPCRDVSFTLEMVQQQMQQWQDRQWVSQHQNCVLIFSIEKTCHMINPEMGYHNVKSVYLLGYLAEQSPGSKAWKPPLLQVMIDMN